MVTTVSEGFYKTLAPLPKLKPMEDFQLVLQGPDGKELPYIGYIEATIEMSFYPAVVNVPVLVVPTTKYNLQVPIIIGTNVIRLAKEHCLGDQVPKEWHDAFLSLQNGYIGFVKSTNKKNIEIKPMETVTISGLVRKRKEVETAVTESTDKASSRMGVCPRVVALDKVGRNQRIPVRVFNMSAKTLQIRPQAPLCELQEVKILRNIEPFKNLETTKSATVSTQTADTGEVTPKLPDGVKLEQTDLTEDQKTKAKEIFSNWETIFSKDLTDIGHTNLVTHHIRLHNEEPFKEPHRRIPPGLIEEVREHLQEMLQAGAIRNSESPFSSNVVIVRKKDGTIRFCVDFRKLNNRTVKDAYAIPRIEDSLHLLAGARYFSKLDLRSGYWQVEVSEDDKHKTAFQVGTLGFYEFNRMPFGLCNAPATFQRLMERCMGDMNLRDCLIYLDDIVVFSCTFDEHIERLQAVFQRLKDNNLKLRASKCDFFKREITYLGHVVSERGIHTDPAKTDSVKTWPVPKTTNDVRIFLGFTGYYRKFIKGYAAIVRPLNDLLVGHCTNKKAQKGRKSKIKAAQFEWGEQQQIAFETIKDRLINPPVLAYADYKLPFKLHTDACLTGLGAVLYQRQDGADRVVAYASRSLRPAERNYPAHKLEFLALKWAITEKFHDYLYGSRFEVLTDNNPLTYVLTSAKLDATGQRWVAALSNYNFDLAYRSGAKNADADGLSRTPAVLSTEQIDFPEVLKAISCGTKATADGYTLAENFLLNENSISMQEDEKIPEDLLRATALSTNDWKRAQHADADISFVIDHVISGHRPNAQQVEAHGIDKRLLRDWEKYAVHDDVLFRNGTVDGQQCKQLILPAPLRDIVFKAYHDDLGHQGRDRTLSLIKRRMFWPGMDSFIQDRIRQCGRCIRRKAPITRAAELVNVVSTAPMEVVCIDFLSLERSKGGHENILVITDHFTRYAVAVPTRNQTAQTTARVLFDSFFVHYGFPAKIHSDQGANFESRLIKSLCKLTGMLKSRTTPYHPMGNGMPERFNRTLLNMLGTLDEYQKADWKSHVPTLTHAYNAATHMSTGHSPFYLMFGRHPRLAVDAFLGLPQDIEKTKSYPDYVDKLKQRLAFAYDTASKEVRKNAEKQKQFYDLRVRQSTLEPGDRVLVRNVGLRGKQKLADQWEHDIYIVKRQPISEIPVFEVVKENSKEKKIRTLHRNMLLPFMGLPCPQTQEIVKKETVKDKEAIEVQPNDLEESDYSDSSKSSDEEEGDEPEIRSSEAYVIPMKRAPGQKGLHPRTKPVETFTRNPENPEALKRGQRNRRPPAWLRNEDFVTSQNIHTFTVPARQVIYL